MVTKKKKHAYLGILEALENLKKKQVLADLYCKCA